MIINDIYQQLAIPPNLQEHMIRVASISLFIIDRWNSLAPNKNMLITILLLHDIGNIVKFDFEKYPEFLGSEEKNVESWKIKQKDVIAKYGSDDHEATQKMLHDLYISDEIAQRIYAMSYWNVKNVIEKDDDYVKIALYSDLRVGPFGIITLADRLEDVHTRLVKYQNKPELKDYAFQLEHQIQQHTSINPEEINNKDIFIDHSLLKHIL